MVNQLNQFISKYERANMTCRSNLPKKWLFVCILIVLHCKTCFSGHITNSYLPQIDENHSRIKSEFGHHGRPVKTTDANIPYYETVYNSHGNFRFASEDLHQAHSDNEDLRGKSHEVKSSYLYNNSDGKGHGKFTTHPDQSLTPTSNQVFELEDENTKLLPYTGFKNNYPKQQELHQTTSIKNIHSINHPSFENTASQQKHPAKYNQGEVPEYLTGNLNFPSYKHNTNSANSVKVKHQYNPVSSNIYKVPKFEKPQNTHFTPSIPTYKPSFNTNYKNSAHFCPHPHPPTVSHPHQSTYHSNTIHTQKPNFPPPSQIIYEDFLKPNLQPVINYHLKPYQLPSSSFTPHYSSEQINYGNYEQPPYIAPMYMNHQFNTNNNPQLKLQSYYPEKFFSVSNNNNIYHRHDLNYPSEISYLEPIMQRKSFKSYKPYQPFLYIKRYYYYTDD